MMLRLALTRVGGARVASSSSLLRRLERDVGRLSVSPASCRSFSVVFSSWDDREAPAFRAFLEKEKYLMVPVKFVVPLGDEQWPRQTWGYKLGKTAAWLRKRRRKNGSIRERALKDLEEMHFAWDWSPYKWDHFVMPMLRHFYELNGHTDVKATFVVPKDDAAWPDMFWGKKLGRQVLKIRRQGPFAKQVQQSLEELEQLGFCHDSTLYDRNWRERVMPALKVFKQEFGHCNVGQSFQVPTCSPWPEAAWGMHLGSKVSLIRTHHLSANRDTRELEELEFVWNACDSEWSDRILPALTAFHKVYGHCRVPISFVVPSDQEWPEQAHDLNLGYVMSNIRLKGTYFDYTTRATESLKLIGFDVKIPCAMWEQRVEPLLTTFEQLHGHCNVPRDFVVPSSAPWEERDWGIHLGSLERKHASK